MNFRILAVLLILVSTMVFGQDNNRWFLYDSSSSCKQYYDLGTIEYNDGNVTILTKSECSEKFLYPGYNKYADYFTTKIKIFCIEKKIILIETKVYWTNSTIDLFPTGENSFFNLGGNGENYLYDLFCK